MKKLRALWQSLWTELDRRIRLARILGLFFIVLGFVLIGLGWNGAASRNYLPSQFPYLLSGGVMGLGSILLGCILLFLATLRAEREVVTKQFEEIARLLGRNLSTLTLSANGSGDGGSAGRVVAGTTVYHREGCRVLEGKDDLATVAVETAVAEGLTACRVCEPPEVAPKEAGSEPAPTS